MNGPTDNISWLDAMLRGSVAIYADASALVVFNFPGGLFVQKHRETADNVDAAERASIDEIQRGLAVYGGPGTQSEATLILGAVDRAFGCGTVDDADFDGRCHWESNRIVSIRREAENWRLVLRNRWDQELILDPAFKVISTRRLPAPGK
jgi:hypothetical protein